MNDHAAVVDSGSTPPERPGAGLNQDQTPAASARVPWSLGIGGLLILVGMLPCLVVYGVNLWSREPYQFFPLAMAGGMFLAWHRLRLASDLPSSASPRIGLTVVAAGGMLLAGASWAWSPWLGTIAALIVLVGVSWTLGGWRLLRTLLPAFLMLAILIRPPLNYDLKLTLALRHLAVQMSSCLFDSVFAVPHFVSGNMIELAKTRLLVEEACSGINSALYVIAFGLFWGLWRRRPVWHVLLLCLASPSFVLLGNLGRITLGGTLQYRHNIDLLHGWQHEVFGLVLFAAYMTLVMSTDAFFAFFTVSAPSSERSSVPAPPDPDPGPGRPVRPMLREILAGSSRLFSPHWALLAGVVFALLAPVQIGKAWMENRAVAAEAPSKKVPANLREGAKFSAPAEMGGWKRVDKEKAQGNVSYLELVSLYSHTWDYQNGRMRAQVALDYPYYDFHDLTECYRNQGWQIDYMGWKGDLGKGINPFVEVTMKKKPVVSGYLLFGGFTGAGKWVDDSFALRTRGRFGLGASYLPVPTYQVQVLVTAYAPLNELEKQQVMQLFSEARDILSKQLLAQLKQP
ncbi:MAG: exosortase U [Verrucomicrobia bacterium]|nr:exosortase U [Verrucomicrobiota bacterium]